MGMITKYNSNTNNLSSRKSKSGRNKKSMISLILLFALLFTSIPMESFAVGEPVINEFSYKVIRDGEITKHEMYFQGTNLENAQFQFGETDLNAIPGATKVSNKISFKITYTDKTSVNILSTNTLIITNDAGSTSYTLRYGSNLPTLSQPDTKMYLGKPARVSGINLKNPNQYNTGNEKAGYFIIAERENRNYTMDTAEPGVAVINVSDGVPGDDKSVAFRVEFAQDTGGIPNVYYQYQINNAVDFRQPINGLDHISVMPTVGPIDGGTTLNIQAKTAEDGTIVTDKNLFDDSMRVSLIKREEPNKGAVLQTLDPKVIITNGFKSSMTVKTPKVTVGYRGSYDLIIYKNNDRFNESVAQNVFRYEEGGTSLSLGIPNPLTGKDSGDTLVRVIGQNIFALDSVAGITKNQPITIQKVEVNPATPEWLDVTYAVPPDTKYGSQNVESITRRIRVEIGTSTDALGELEVLTTQPASIHSAHFTQASPNLDGIIVRTNRNEAQSYDVVMQTHTTITLEGQVNPLPVIIEEAKAAQKYTYDRTLIEPRITKIEPLYGYYNNLIAQGIQLPHESASDERVKPLMLRVHGEDFAVERVQNAEGVFLPKYPDIRLIDNEETGAEYDELKAKVVKVLKNGQVVSGEKGNQLGDTMIVEIAPSGYDPDSTLPNNGNYNFSKDILEQGVVGNGYKSLKTKLLISQTSGNNDNTAILEPAFEFRYPTSNDKERQPYIENVYSGLTLENASQAKTLNSEEENDIIIRFIATPVQNIDKIVVTIDGMDMKDYIEERGYDPRDKQYGYIRLKTPIGLQGETRIQIIVQEGLMDSYELNFQPVTGPWLKQLIPNNGQAGTWTTLKRDSDRNNIAFIKPTSATDRYTGSIVLIDGKEITTDYEVKDADTIIFKIPENTAQGNRKIQVQNPDKSRSQELAFLVRDVQGDKMEILSIDPDKGDYKGGIPATITAKEGSSFSGGADVYFASQKAEIIGTNLDFTQLYIKIPALNEIRLDAGKEYSVPVTVQKRESGVTGTIENGFTYFNPTYSDLMKINKIYKKDVRPETNKGNVGDQFWIEGDNFLAYTDENGDIVMPSIYFGYNKAEILEVVGPGQIGEIKRLPRILVKVPNKPLKLNADGSVDVMVINYNGGTAIKEKGFIYSQGTPSIIEKESILQASRFDGQVTITAKDVIQNGLLVAFGERIDRLDITDNTPAYVVTTGSGKVQMVEKLRITYNEKNPKEILVYYEDPSGTPVLMDDLVDVSGQSIGSGFTLDKVAEKKIVGINWKNPDYHKNTTIASQPELLSRLNKEYVSFEIVPNDRVNTLVIRRGLGHIQKFTLNQADNTAKIIVNTPYNDKIEKTTVTLINSDDSSATAPFEFHGGLDSPVITDLEGSKERTVTLDGAQQKIKAKTQDYTVDGTLKIMGKNFKDVQSARIGSKEVKIEAISPDYTYMIVSVPKAQPAEIGQPLEVSVVTKEGNAFSSRNTPPVYFMYIAADSKPVIQSVTPVIGPRTGGTLVTIKGTGFRERDEFGVISDKVEERITVTVNGSMPAGLKSTVKNELGEIVELKVVMPPSITGKAKLQVVNADGGTSEPKDFTYVSQPKISKTEGSLFFNDTTSEIRLFGEDFVTGAKVILGAEQTKGKKPADASVSGMLGVTADGINQEAHLTGGVEAADVKVTGTNQITFKMPEAIESLENTSIIILNPDTGMSEPGQGNIKPPVPDVPDIEAIPGFERTMILRWTVDKDVLNAAEKFEIYVRERRSGDYTFVGDTKQDTTEQSYVIKGLKYDTTYDILVRVLNKYGEAEDFASVRETTLKQNQDYKEKEKLEAVDKAVAQIETQGKQEVIGDTLYYTVGTRESTINLSNTTAKNKTKYVQIPVRDIKAGNKTITITDKDLSLTVSYSSLNTPELRNAPDDAVFRFKISAAEKQVEEGLARAIPRVYKKASNVYGIYFELAQPKLVTPIAMLSGSATININAPAFPKYHAVYIESADTFSILQANIITQGGNYVLLTNK
jgi:hypothetical protein